MKDVETPPDAAPHPIEQKERLRKVAQGLAVGYVFMAMQSLMRSWPVRLLKATILLALLLAAGYGAAVFLGLAPADPTFWPLG